MLFDLGFPQSEPTVLFQDNQSTIKLLTDETYHARAIHIYVHIHFIRELITNHAVVPEYLPTSDMPSDLLTNLRGSFLRLRSYILFKTSSFLRLPKLSFLLSFSSSAFLISLCTLRKFSVISIACVMIRSVC